ncbi:hypothetical protein [Pseudomonas chlororaphis]|uniref:hypothetical protein n=1 Tax=Pseudomonas chlororaphis TaxID=587753 RepID=UPI000F558FE3|nr:hypothetical protein [Pseudomonas chlororaphis]AZD15185.1 hypothetical protein C4K25_2256 [Pseudomonas chlororaphis]WDG54056.1 hypothetical protein PUP76_30020 [Pseudomonas chlororaphis]WDH49614.1 hypothetical protein PUP66_12285 [Pseudomonas chlororaphis]WDH61464.1 hypothetical protein PUP56_12285 [Pseudomonas chlororaphis]WDH90738.1 hypothetical protein PUP74_12155 [Pseudomonas chlororaphis]
MAGKRQHYVPRFLQCGFLDDPDHKAKRAWLHRRNAQAQLVGIKDIGVGENFYSKLQTDGAKTLDDLITEIEVELLQEFSTLKRMPVNQPIDPKIAARLTTHLMLRTAYLRSLFEQGATKVFDAAISLFTDPEVAQSLIDLDKFSGVIDLKGMIDEALQTFPLDSLSFPRPLAHRTLSFMVRENFASLFEESGVLITQLLTDLPAKISISIRNAHNKVLEVTQQTKWEEGLAELSWCVQDIVGAVLPDCVVLAREVGHELKPLLLSNRKNINLVILPLAHDRLLIGWKGAKGSIDVKSLNAASAACSDSFFISHRADDGMTLSQLIGQRSINTINASISEALSDFRLPSKDIKASNIPYEPDINGTQSIISTSFSLVLKDFGNSGMATRLGEILKVIIHETGQGIPISTLDGITFALDYPTALATLDRGDKATNFSESQPRDYGRPVAKTVQVLRKGKPKLHIVIDAVIADWLLSEDDDNRASAIHLLLTMLSELVHKNRYETQLEGASTVAPDEVSKMLLSSISTAPSSYFCAKQSAFADPKAGERYAGLVKDSFAAAQEAIKAARIVYRTSNDINALLNVALPRISFVLTHAAEWLGHREGLPEHDSFPGSSLPGDLEAFELNRWLELFGRDLRNLYNLEGQFTTDNIFALSRHVERLLWTVQICPWPMEDGSPYVSVPLGNDLAILHASS